ncbi:MAG: helix-turn-helix domain-containing protein [Gammaproteobacteria bacterium]|nr:helix-turn-helix domain-containing protein [Gammaproteobacteria bacterium]MBT6081322.1 helix-turn-helix domain-containing protein [Gammaproteobacteria bacterium]MBT8006006.1 helix-turn-helix domain-containing protein [Gammaproteobacteria bacterium]
MAQKKQPAVLCPQCELNDVCRQYEKDDALRAAGESLGDVTPQNNVAKGVSVCQAENRFEYLYAVHEGAFKSVVTLPGGEERVTGFHFAGEIIGAEGVSTGKYGRTVVALQDGQVCYFPETAFSADENDNSKIRQGLLMAMSHQVKNEQWTGLMAAHRAEQRVALFLFMISKRFEFHGFPSNEFRLPMSRDDIASYLGLAVETVSRSFQKLKGAGMIQVSGRNVILEDRDALQGFS